MNMIKLASQVIKCSAIAVLLAATAGCATGAPASRESASRFAETRDAKIPQINQQPEDHVAHSGQDAVFKVEAKGKGLTYHWYFTSGGEPEQRKGTDEKQPWLLDIRSVTLEQVGVYWCDIQSRDRFGAQVSTRTRLAALGSIGAPTSTGFPPETQPYVPTGPITNHCGTNCGYVVFYNGNGYTTNKTKYTAWLSMPDPTPVPKANYALMWRWNGTDAGAGCFDDVPDPSVSKYFNSIANKTYVFTAYFRPEHCLKLGTKVTIHVSCQ